MVTAYDASFAAQADAAGVDAVLVGDSLGMVVQGHASTLPVSIDEMAYHSAAVARGMRRALLIADLPFMSYATRELAYASAARLIGAGGAAMSSSRAPAGRWRSSRPSANATCRFADTWG